MNSQEDRAYRSWAKFLDPDSLKSNLIVASIFLTAYELLRSSAIDRIRDFFAYDFDENGGMVTEDYKIRVLSLDKSPFRASLLWLKEMSAIDEADIKLVNEIRKHRNEIAHELPKFIATVEAEVNISLLEGMCQLISKIDTWWIKEVDIPTNSDFDDQEIADSDMYSGRILCIKMMLQTVRGDSSELWDEFQNQTSNSRRK